MEREERALSEVDRISSAVENLRELLIAAAVADLRAHTPPAVAEDSDGQPPLP